MASFGFSLLLCFIVSTAFCGCAHFLLVPAMVCYFNVCVQQELKSEESMIKLNKKYDNINKKKHA